MSVIVEGLTKIYGDQNAVDNISFQAKPGEVLGFLGPNGAGKSTTMKMITCFIPQTSGKASVTGYDINKDTMKVRGNVGYLPENNPLYTEMYVKEYLQFIARTHHLSKADARIREMIHVTGLEREQKKKIRQLSKGYRQRVGLAQAMLHDPKVLILDEPTAGLDPNQLSEIRELIKNLGKEKTVIFSTHIMQEVQAVCDRVVIISKGKIVANAPTEELQQRAAGEAVVNVEFKDKVDLQLIKQIKGVRDVKHLGSNKFNVITSGNKDLREEIFLFAKEKNLTLLTLTKEKQSLEEVFKELTK